MVTELRSVEKAIFNVCDGFSQRGQSAGLINQNCTLLPIQLLDASTVV